MYKFVGPAELLQRVNELEGGRTIRHKRDFLAFAPEGSSPFTLTFVILQGGLLIVDERATEHVVCANGQPVLSAGELTLQRHGAEVELVSVTNQSTGYCPEPELWPDVHLALSRLGFEPPDNFTTVFEFRRCSQCQSINIIKEQDFYCAVCEAALPHEWNF